MTAAEKMILNKLNDLQRDVGGFIQGQTTQDKQISELFSKHANLERNGCSKADQHKDHEDRLRMIEHENGRRPIKETTQERGVSLGRWFRVSGYRMQDVVLLLFALMVLGMAWSLFQGRQQMQRLANNMQAITEGGVRP